VHLVVIRFEFVCVCTKGFAQNAVDDFYLPADPRCSLITVSDYVSVCVWHRT